MTNQRRLRLARRVTAADWIDHIAEEYEIKREKVEEVAKHVPGPAVQWAVALMIDRQVSYPEDYPRVNEAYTFVQNHKADGTFAALVKQKLGVTKPKNILQYSLRGLEDVMTEMEKKKKGPEDDDELSQNQKVQWAKKNGAEIVYREGPYVIAKCGGEGKDPEAAAIAACYYGQGTRWCTSSWGLNLGGRSFSGSAKSIKEQAIKAGFEMLANKTFRDPKTGQTAQIEPSTGTAKSYLRGGPLWILIKAGQPIGQWNMKEGQIETLQFMDPTDRPLRIHLMDKNDQLAMVKSGMMGPRGALDYWVKEGERHDTTLEILEYDWPLGAKVLARDPKLYEEYKETVDHMINEGFLTGEKADRWKADRQSGKI
jgi:hypothetical protein